MKMFSEAILTPTGTALAFTIGAGIIYFVADYCLVSAYINGGSVLLVSTIVAMFPVFASLIKYFMLGELPNLYQLGGWVLAAGAVILVSYGETLKIQL